jgi:hypothetical protein
MTCSVREGGRAFRCIECPSLSTFTGGAKAFLLTSGIQRAILDMNSHAKGPGHHTLGAGDLALETSESCKGSEVS